MTDEDHIIWGICDTNILNTNNPLKWLIHDQINWRLCNTNKVNAKEQLKWSDLGSDKLKIL